VSPLIAQPWKYNFIENIVLAAFQSFINRQSTRKSHFDLQATSERDGSERGKKSLHVRRIASLEGRCTEIVVKPGGGKEKLPCLLVRIPQISLDSPCADYHNHDSSR
jgi:hypothetical protein